MKAENGTREASHNMGGPEEIVLRKEAEKPSLDFPVIGIGASAGGLAAFEAFFSGIPIDIETNMAFIIIQHLAPDHRSILTELVQRYTRLQVYEVKDGMTVMPNCIYIIPPNWDMTISNGILHLIKPAAPRGHRMPIDTFFSSLAQDQLKKAICIILSGTGSDGSQGVRRINEEGGMVMVQTPDSADFDGMPKSAIATGLADYVLSPAEMYSYLKEYASYLFGNRRLADIFPSYKVKNALKSVFSLLHSRLGYDFSMYKPNTILRRIDRRMAILQIKTLDGYVEYLKETPAEIQALFYEFLIGVTSFFRDPKTFKVLEEKAIGKLFADKTEGDTIRIWVPGCSTGEEAYSIAILLWEKMDALKLNYNIKIFATDINNRAIEKARAGFFAIDIAGKISPERLERFFSIEPNKNEYRINKTIRDLLIFSEHNIIKDPPFSKLDLISCRNLMIYMSGELHEKLIPLFHYALNPGGILFLGTSENVGEFNNLFAVLDRKSKLYQRKEDINWAERRLLSRFLLPATSLNKDDLPINGKTARAIKPSLREIAEKTLLQKVVSVGALVNKFGDILYLHGRTGQYLEPSPGESGINNILKMARNELRRDFTIALQEALRKKEMVRYFGLRVITKEHSTTFNLTVCPVPAEEMNDEPLYLFVFEETMSIDSEQERLIARQSTAGKGGQQAETDERIVALREELKAKDEYLHTTIMELDTVNEELKSSNEEMQSMNEELQSINEELETSKEELQSMNEELATINAELQTKVADLYLINNDMNNLLAGTEIGTIFVDFQLRILRFTPTITKMINLISSDIGRPVTHIVSNIVGYNNLAQDVHEVLDTLSVKEIEVKTNEGRWYMMRILPYRTLENVVKGAVISFFDITKMKESEQLLALSEIRYRRLFETSKDGILIVDAETGMILNVNQFLIDMLGYSHEQFLGKAVWDIRPLKDIVKNKRNFLKFQQKEYERYEDISIVTAKGLAIDVDFISSAYFVENKKVIQFNIRDITERKKSEEEILYLSYHDQLTGLYNRRFYDTVRNNPEGKKQAPLSLIMLDVNGLKLTNDAFGHKSGDILLNKLADILKRECRTQDIAARIGGDEFVLILPETDIKNADKIIDRINAAIANEKTGDSILSVSIGVSVAEDESADLDDVFKKAEDEMYRHKLSEKSSMRSTAINIIMKTLFEKNNREMRHSQRVSTLCEKIAIIMDFDDDNVNKMRMEGLMHDIGKIGIDEKVLNKQQKLNANEWNEIKRHPEIGYRILSSSKEFSEISKDILQHHERWDGTGYPMGLKGKKIQLQARILAIADSYDAMSSTRTYGPLLNDEQAAEEIIRCSGKQFDPAVARIFIEKFMGKKWKLP